MKKEIIIITLHFSNGGAERVLSELINEWNKMHYKLTIVELRPTEFKHKYFVPESVEVITFGSSNNRIIRRVQNVIDLVNLLKSRPNATVLSFVNPAILVLGISSLFVDNKIIFSERCDPYQSPEKKYQRIVKKVLYELADIAVFQTGDAKKYFSKNVQKKGIVIPNPVNPNLPIPFEGERRPTIVTACQLTEQKNIPLLIESFSRISSEFPDYTLEIYGQGHLKDDLQKLIDDLNLSNKVFLKGFVSNLYECIRDSSIYVMPSNYEGISNSMIEALALGIPTIATDCPIGGAKLMIKNNVNGILVPVNDIDALTDSIKKLIYNKEFANIISKNATNVRREYPASVIAEKWALLF